MQRRKARIGVHILVCVLFATSVYAQRPITLGRSITWDLEFTVAEFAQGLTYTLYVDDAPQVLTGVQCTTNPALISATICTAPIPPLVSGKHILELTASLDAETSEKSNQLALLFGVIQDPTRLRIQ